MSEDSGFRFPTFLIARRLTPLPLHCLITLAIAAFTFFLAHPHISENLFQSLPIFLILMLATLQILSAVRQMDEDYTTGMLGIFLSHGISSHKYIMLRLGSRFFFESIPLCILTTTIFYGGVSSTNEKVNLILASAGFFISCLLLSLQIQSLSLLLGSLRLHQRIGSILSVFLIWPLLIPGFLLSFTLIESLSSSISPQINSLLSAGDKMTFIPFSDLFLLHLAVSLMSVGLTLLLSPRLIRFCFEG